MRVGSRDRRQQRTTTSSSRSKTTISSSLSLYVSKNSVQITTTRDHPSPNPPAPQVSKQRAAAAPILPPRAAAEDVRVLVGDRARARDVRVLCSAPQRRPNTDTVLPLPTPGAPPSPSSSPLHHWRPNPGARPRLIPARSIVAARSTPPPRVARTVISLASFPGVDSWDPWRRRAGLGLGSMAPGAACAGEGCRERKRRRADGALAVKL